MGVNVLNIWSLMDINVMFVFFFSILLDVPLCGSKCCIVEFGSF
jgi:hypothetical protein